MYGIEIKNYSQFMIISKPKKKDITNSTVQVCKFIDYSVKTNVEIKNVLKITFSGYNYLFSS